MTDEQGPPSCRMRLILACLHLEAQRRKEVTCILTRAYVYVDAKVGGSQLCSELKRYDTPRLHLIVSTGIHFTACLVFCLKAPPRTVLIMFRTFLQPARLRTPAAGPSTHTHAHQSFLQTRRTLHDLPFRPPPIRERLKPLIPFFIWWTIITSLTVHQLRIRTQTREDMERFQAKVGVLERLMERTRNGEVIRPAEMRREMELVGLRERVVRGDEDGRGEVRDVGWREAIFGRKRKEEDVSEEDVSAWAADGALFLLPPLRTSNDALYLSNGAWLISTVIREASSESKPTIPTSPETPIRSGTTRRAPSANVYL